MKTKYKFIHFKQLENSLWACNNNKSLDTLGYVEYYPRWKQYVFSTLSPDVVFNVSCLNDIADFIKQLKNKIGE